MEALPESEEEAGSSEEEESEESEDEEEMENSRMKIPKSGNKLNAAGPSQGKANELSEDEDDEDEDDSDSDEELAGRMQRGAGISTPGSDEPDRTRILSVLELEDLFLKQAPEGAFRF